MGFLLGTYHLLAGRTRIWWITPATLLSKLALDFVGQVLLKSINHVADPPAVLIVGFGVSKKVSARAGQVSDESLAGSNIAYLICQYVEAE